MTNTPEKIKQWEDAAIKYSENVPIEQDEPLHTLDLKHAYLQGRQDEWRECQKEIERLKELVRLSFNAGHAMSSRDKGWLDFGEFKELHNLND